VSEKSIKTSINQKPKKKLFPRTIKMEIPSLPFIRRFSAMKIELREWIKNQVYAVRFFSSLPYLPRKILTFPSAKCFTKSEPICCSSSCCCWLHPAQLSNNKFHMFRLFVDARFVARLFVFGEGIIRRLRLTRECS